MDREMQEVLDRLKRIEKQLAAVAAKVGAELPKPKPVKRKSVPPGERVTPLKI